MLRDLKTIFSRLPASSDKKETAKISYWLEKLFNQERKEIEKKELQTVQDSLQEVAPPTAIPLNEQTIEEKGLEEAAKIQVEKTETDKNKLEKMLSDSNRILTTTSSVFPLTIFPTTLNVEATRITIIYRQLFSSQVHSVDIKDISNVLIETGILFATLTIISRTYTENNITIGTIWKNDAIFIRRIIEGLRMLAEEHMDTTNYTVEELLQKLKKLSTTKIVL